MCYKGLSLNSWPTFHYIVLLEEYNFHFNITRFIKNIIACPYESCLRNPFIYQHS